MGRNSKALTWHGSLFLNLFLYFFILFFLFFFESARAVGGTASLEFRKHASLIYHIYGKQPYDGRRP